MQGSYVQYKVVFNRKNEFNKEQKALIQIRAYLNGQTRYFSTGIYVTSNDWNEKKMQPKDPILIRKVEQLLDELKRYEFEVRTKRDVFQLADFSLYGQPVEKTNSVPASFTDFYAQQINEEHSLHQVSWKARKNSLEVFKSFQQNVLFSAVTYELLHKFDRFLQIKKSYKSNTVHKHLKHLRKYVLLALRYKYLTENPFDYYPLKEGETNAQFLTNEEIERLERLTFTPEQWRLEKSRDMFLFSCFTGLRFSDVKKLLPSDFDNTNEGLVLKYKANKTAKEGKKFISILYDGKPSVIVKKYITNDLTRPLFKGITNPKVNKDLKELAKMAAIASIVRFKDSRDTFGTDMVGKTDLRVVQDELQHSSIKTTNKYVQMSDELKKKRLTSIKWK